jgi:glutamyl-tRNA synthetase
MNRVHKGGAKFDYEKAKWFNQEWIKNKSAADLAPLVHRVLQQKGMEVAIDEKLLMLIDLVKDRCVFVTDFEQQLGYFYQRPVEIDIDAIKAKWNDDKQQFFIQFAAQLSALEEWSFENIEQIFKTTAATASIKPGELQLPFRIMLVGGKFGPAVFQIAEILGKEETVGRIKEVKTN